MTPEWKRIEIEMAKEAYREAFIARENKFPIADDYWGRMKKTRLSCHEQRMIYKETTKMLLDALGVKENK